jgi:ribonuclease HI
MKMAWERLFETDQLEIIVDTDKGHVMLETSSGGAVPKYVTVHIQNEQEIEALIHALQKAKEAMLLINK